MYSPLFNIRTFFAFSGQPVIRGPNQGLRNPFIGVRKGVKGVRGIEDKLGTELEFWILIPGNFLPGGSNDAPLSSLFTYSFLLLTDTARSNRSATEKRAAGIKTGCGAGAGYASWRQFSDRQRPRQPPTMSPPYLRP